MSLALEPRCVPRQPQLVAPLLTEVKLLFLRCQNRLQLENSLQHSGDPRLRSSLLPVVQVGAAPPACRGTCVAAAPLMCCPLPPRLQAHRRWLRRPRIPFELQPREQYPFLDK